MPLRPPAYTLLAAVYDRWQESYSVEYGHSILPKLHDTFRRYVLRPSSLLDLGCGTGTMALLLAREGWDVVGVDASEGMIAEAQRKAEAAGVQARFFRADLRVLSLHDRFDAAVSLYDVFNHLSDVEELSATLRNTRRVLRTGGVLIFDVNNARGYRRLWRDRETIRHRDFTMVLENRFSPAHRRAVSDIRVSFTDGGEDLVETIEQKYFLKREIRAALESAGFAVSEARDFAFPSAPGAGKLKTWWVTKAV
jgi:ubiquinone/menaquinone biosynthesis C-methylase UbiE